MLDSKKLVAVTPNELRHVWPIIRKEVGSVEAPEGLLPEDVYGACLRGDSALFLLHVNDQQIGWMVLRKIDSDLHIWMLYARPGFEPMTLFREELMEMARTAATTKLTFGSRRRGWDRVAERHGFKLRMVVYECEVE